MREFHAYIGRDGYLTISPYRGEANRQEYQRRIKQDVGIYPATDIQAARKIALTFIGVTK